MAGVSPRSGLLRPLSALVVLVLVAQFLAGIAVALYVQIPSHHPGAHPAEYFSGAARSVTWALVNSGLPWLVVHVVVGILLFLLALALLVVAIRSGRRGYAWATGFGLAGVIAAGFNGASFLNYHEDFSSMLMSGGFALAVTSYMIGLLLPGSIDAD
jgi:hypothetical protein